MAAIVHILMMRKMATTEGGNLKRKRAVIANAGQRPYGGDGNHPSTHSAVA